MADSSPRFRHDLIATAVEIDGVRYVDVRDANRGTTFRFYDFEYDLARQLDGRPAAEISAWAIATYGLDLTPVGIAEFAARLAELGFLQAETVSGSIASPSSRTLSGVGGDPPPLRPQTRVVAEAAAGRGRPPLVPYEDDNQPLSQVVSRTIDASASPPAGGAVRRSSSEFSVAGAAGRPTRTTPIGGQRISSPSQPAVPRWMSEIDSGPQRPSGGRDLMPPIEPPVAETQMGFAAVTELAAKPAPEMTVEPSEAMGTVMGFAAVTEKQIQDAETAATARVSTPPPGTAERRLPPRPDSVIMAPFQAEEPRGRLSEVGERRLSGPTTDRPTIIVILVVTAAVISAVVGYYFWSQRQAAMEARRVRVIAPQPAAVYRWFDAPGSAVVPGTVALAFASSGSVADVLPPGSRYAAGEIIAKLQGAAAFEAEVNRSRSRVAYNQQIRDSMKAAGNLPEMRRAEIRIVEKQAQLDEAEAALDRLVIRASEPGEVADVVAKRGAMVEANSPAVRVRVGTLRGEFTLAAKDAEAAAHLGFCRVEIAGIAPAMSADARPAEGIDAAAEPDGTPRYADCKLTGQPPTAGQRFEVELPPGAGILLGQPLRLARVRYDGVFPVPRAAVVRVGETDRLFVVGPGDLAQARAITIADSDSDDVVVSQGIDVGDRVIVDPPSDLREGSPLTVLQGQSR